MRKFLIFCGCFILLVVGAVAVFWAFSPGRQQTIDAAAPQQKVRRRRTASVAFEPGGKWRMARILHAPRRLAKRIGLIPLASPNVHRDKFKRSSGPAEQVASGRRPS